MKQGLIGMGFAALAGLAAPAGQATADTFDTSHGAVEVTAEVTGLNRPWGFAFLPDGALLITERPGALRIWDGTLSAPISGLPPLFSSGQGGLLDVALAHNFAASGEIYFSYAARTRNAAQTRVARARLDRAAMTVRDVEVIFAQEPPQQTGHHFGSHVVVAPDGSIFITVGDRGERDRAQSKQAHQGGVMRITRDGAPHSDNPFITGGGLPEIFSYGHRNPQGAVWAHDALWTVEHGAKGGMKSTGRRRVAIMAGPSSVMASIIPGPKLALAHRRPAWSSRSIIGTLPLHHRASRLSQGRCFRRGRGISWSGL